jgi:hypothetical protein
VYRLITSNDFAIDLSTYPLDYIHGIEVLIRYNPTENGEKWFLKAYNWATSDFSDAGFNTTQGNQPASNQGNEYAITVTDGWTDYVNNEGVMRLQFLDEGVNTNQTIVGIDFLGARAIIDGTRLDLKNSSPLSLRIVAVWIENSTAHNRFDADLFLNSGESATYIRADITLPQDVFLAKVVTERGNIAVFSED